MAPLTTTITNIVTGTSDDGRISYSSCQNGPTIDGRRAWRGHYINSQGLADDSTPVNPTDWRAACSLMHQVDTLHQENQDRRARADLDAEIARAEKAGRLLEVASRGRGSIFDPNMKD